MNSLRKLTKFPSIRGSRPPASQKLLTRPGAQKSHHLHATRRHPGYLNSSLLRLQARVNSVPMVPEEKEYVTDRITNTNFFKVLDEPLRFIFKLPFIQSFYLHWLHKEKKFLIKSLQEKEYYIFLGELLFYNQLGIATFEKALHNKLPRDHAYT